MPTLHWLTREDDLKASGRTPYRLLKHVETYGRADTENMLIQGDNLDALKALLPYYAGQVKCIYIDPPYNTRSAFAHYDDNLEHTTWLAMMYPRLELLRELLSENGIICISINDDECHYLKAICDEIFGRKNFISSLIWNTEGNTDNQAAIINYHEYILLYAKSGSVRRPNTVDINVSTESKIYRDEIRNTIVKNGPKNPESTITIPIGFSANFEKGTIKKGRVNYPKYNDEIHVGNYKTLNAVSATSGWSSKKIFENFIKSGFMAVPDSKQNLTSFEITKNGTIEAFKARDKDVGHFVSVLRNLGTTNQMRILLKKIGIDFTYPKPVDLIGYLIESFTRQGDIILDSFAGSATTAHAVFRLNAEGQKRKFILIEREEGNVNQVIIPRLTSVINGNRDAMIDATGGGFKFYRLGEAIFTENGQIRPDIKFNELAAHVWFSETKTPWPGLGVKKQMSPLLGVHEGLAYYLLYNGILKDKSPGGGNVLTSKILAELPPHNGPKVIYGERCLFSPPRLKALEIIFKHTPYDIKGR